MSNSREFYTLDDFDFFDKRVIVRVDINLPLDPETGRILDDTRMRNHIQTIKDLEEGRVIILAHQSRPGKKDFTNLKLHAERLSQLINRKVKYIDSLFDNKALAAIKGMRNGEIILLENTRFYSEDVALKNAKPEVQAKCHIVSRLASGVDYFVNDAFAAVHRSQPTLVGFAEILPSIAGRLMERELLMLGKVMEAKGNTVAIFGGAKVDDSIRIIGHMLENNIASHVLTGGLVASIFLIAQGHDVGKGSMDIIEKEVPDHEGMTEMAKSLMDKYPNRIGIPSDVVLNENGNRLGMPIELLPEAGDFPIFDIGLDTMVNYIDIVKKAENIIVNGPMGVFELEEFSFGTVELFKAIADSNAFSVVGGGHTATVVARLGLEDRIDHVSTGGGALITMLSGEPLPVVEALKRSMRKFPKK